MSQEPHVPADSASPVAKVSVVIPVQNRPVVVRHAIDSVLAQTCQDFEIIVVDDGSTDNTAAAVEAIDDPRIVLVKHERNRGASSARNSGIWAGRAPFVAFLDSDDEWFPTRLEKMLQVFESSSDRVGMVYTGAERILDDGTRLKEIPTERNDLDRMLLIDNVIGGTSVAMVRRSVLDAIGGFDETLRYTEERDLWLRIAERSLVRCIPEVLVRIPQPTDRPRLSLHTESVSVGREMFCRKHRDKLVKHGSLHLHLRDTGLWEQRYARNFRRARRCYVESISAWPFSPLTYLLLASACLPQSCQDITARCSRQLKTWLQPAVSALLAHRFNGGAGRREDRH
jgi:cellulose synthase/poly-beta-1,6-N-acetylglucosamine synthase-like glycosyltransferase